MTNSMRFLLHLFLNESRPTSETFAHTALLVGGLISSFLFCNSTTPAKPVAQRQLDHHVFTSVVYCSQGTDGNCTFKSTSLLCKWGLSQMGLEARLCQETICNTDQ